MKTINDILEAELSPEEKVKIIIEKKWCKSFHRFSCNYQPEKIVKAYCEIDTIVPHTDVEDAPIVHVEETVAKCDCGHTCTVAQKMSTTKGSSCPECYDRMED